MIGSSSSIPRQQQNEDEEDEEEKDETDISRQSPEADIGSNPFLPIVVMRTERVAIELPR